MKHLTPSLYLRSFVKTFRSNKSFAFLFLGYTISSLALFFYSFTQIDLNLTMISYPLIHNLQQPFMDVGYYQRPLSTFLYSVIICGYFILFFLTLLQIHKKKITVHELSFLITIIIAALFFSYPAFSHDIFNYMFDAKIFTHYGDNPYTMRALDYLEDPWIRFMHWTHRTYPYGPVFLPISIILSFLGMNIFPLTLLLFKGLMLASYIGTTIFIYKILVKTSPQHAVAGTAFFALNPLVIFETLVSSHHDIVMMFFAVVAVYLFILKKKILSFLFFLLSVGVKYVTVFLSPLFVLGFQPAVLFAGGVAATTAVIYRLGLQPWYLLWVLPFAALLYKFQFVRIGVGVLSFIFLLRYIPFLATGEWPSGMLELHDYSILYFLVIYGIGYAVWYAIKRR